MKIVRLNNVGSLAQKPKINLCQSFINLLKNKTLGKKNSGLFFVSQKVLIAVKI